MSAHCAEEGRQFPFLRFLYYSFGGDLLVDLSDISQDLEEAPCSSTAYPRHLPFPKMFEFLNAIRELDDSHYDQDRNALKRKEWERRSQEVQQDEDLFASGFSLFGEPYKTNKGDALASRVQNTLGNYDEMKDLLTNHSNQSQLVGIPKNSIPQTPTEKNEQSFFPDQRNRMIAPHQGSSQSVPLLSSVTSSSSHQNIRKPRADWPRAGHCSTITQASQSTGLPNRMKQSNPHDQPQGRYEDLFNCQSDQHKNGGMEDASMSTSSSNSRRLSHSKASGGDHFYKESIPCPSPIDFEFLANGPISPLSSTSLLSSASSLSVQNFPQGLYCKTSMVQQKPTAYVRPMDGQEQLPDFSPALKPLLEIESGYSSQTFGTLLEGKPSATTAKTKLPKLTIPQPSEINLSNDPNCVEEILRDLQLSTSAYSVQKWSDPEIKAATKPPVPQKSMLEDDLKISSDEDEIEQDIEKAKTMDIPSNPTVPPAPEPVVIPSSGGSESSSSDSSSESDSDSESSSSDSEGNEESRSNTPEPEPPSTNKWQLDKWLNKVNPQNKTIISNQNETSNENNPLLSITPQTEVQNKAKVTPGLFQIEPKERPLLSPLREKARQRLMQKPPPPPPPPLEAKTSRQKSPAQNEAASQKIIVKKQPQKVERTPSTEEYPWSRPNIHPSNTPKEKDTLEHPEQAKARNRAAVGKLAPRKEPKLTAAFIAEKKKFRGPGKIAPKSREFVETDSSTSDSNTDQDEALQVKPVPPCPTLTSALKPKEAPSNTIFNVSTLTGSSSSCSSSSSLCLDIATNEVEEPLFSPLPIGQTELLSPIRDYDDTKALWVKIDLDLLSRVPGQDPPETTSMKSEPRDNIKPPQTQTPQIPQARESPGPSFADKMSGKNKRKFKPSDHLDLFPENKKQRLEDGPVSSLFPPCISPIPSSQRFPSTKENVLAKKVAKKRDDKLFPPPLSPLSDEPLHRRISSDSKSSFSQEVFMPTAFPAASCSFARPRKNESKTHLNFRICGEDTYNRGPSIGLLNSNQLEMATWSSMSSMANGSVETRRPRIHFDNMPHSADYYMQEAKKLKHKADALVEKFGKAIYYTDAALSFIECGNAMERDPLEAKSPYTMYSETVELIRYALRLKNFTCSSSTEWDKRLAILCYRCLSLLYLRMFKLKRDHAMKYSRSLMEYFKTSSKAAQIPWGNYGKSAEVMSPLSLSPSSSNALPSLGPIVIPHRIHHMAASHVNITNNVLRGYEHWDMADRLTRENREFFADLDSLMGPLTQHSTMTNLVRYIRQGLYWLRLEAHLS
ncbi:AF4/FMR2 family member 2 isoform X2 [Monodelphis domestica]|uniref:ALF transcription elongation factor 2 n=1 Tax=Monodelphis domestica TaxID=13616 RepID=F7F3C1_MONDO|nr:AF4/FMR2 family member 2 isoform X2 [Monodelphis domestica]